MPNQKRGIGVKLDTPSDTSRLCFRCGVGVCISMSGIRDSRAGAALGRQDVPLRDPSILVGVENDSGAGGMCEGMCSH